MYVTSNKNTTSLEEEINAEAANWFELGELDYNAGLSPQYESEWYLMGYNDRAYQVEVDFNINSFVFDDQVFSCYTEELPANFIDPIASDINL